MAKTWKLKPQVSEDVREKIITAILSNPHPGPLPEGEGERSLMVQLLFNRGLTDKHQIDDFLNPNYENLHDPFLFKDMQKAVNRIWQAIQTQEKICIYGDYDADAVTANAVLQQTFRYLGVDVESYIPDRFAEGYGVNLEALLRIKDQGSRIVITVDCGTNSRDAADFCKSNGIDLIVTDHHEIIGPLPEAFALINPKNPEDKYPYHELTGVGVAFKLACGILKSGKREVESGKRINGWEKWLLDLVAIGTVADCHTLLGENRILVKYGLKVLEKTKWVGLRALIASSGLDFSQKLPDTYTLGFIIAPRLNAAGRLEHADIALHLLMENDPVQAQQRAIALEALNQKRRDLTGRVLSEAREQALKYRDRKVLVLLGQDWPKGVVGLAAGRIAEEFYKPTIVLNRENVESTGSARTVGEFSVIKALKYAADHLIKFGGHQQAAGLTLKTSEYELFYGKILEYANKNLSEEDSKPVLKLESELYPDNLQLTTYNLLANFEPFGVGNPKPKFMISGLKITSVRLVGSLQNHLQMSLVFSGVIARSAEGEAILLQKKIASDALAMTERRIPAIMFNATDFAKTLKVGDTIDAAAELIKDGWNGREEVKLRIIDIKVK